MESTSSGATPTSRASSRPWVPTSSAWTDPPTATNRGPRPSVALHAGRSGRRQHYLLGAVRMPHVLGTGAILAVLFLGSPSSPES
jgi:hypothetical protein